MQGMKKLQFKVFYDFNLGDFIDENNFYRVLDNHLDLSFVYELTKPYYSHTGQPGLDPVVFFKCLLIAYLENIAFDRALERQINMRMDLRYFLHYDIDEKVPDHSTLCKTRKRIPTHVFEEVFNYILKECVKSGLVKGDIQSIDSAYINANASLDRMKEVKLIDRDPKAFLKEVRSSYDDNDIDVGALAKKRVEKHQKNQEQFTEYRRKKYSDLDGGKPKRKNSRRFLSNVTHQSTTDPDARVAKKSGKPRMLCYTALIATDTMNNVITHASAQHADKKDSRLLQDCVYQLDYTLDKNNLLLKSILADAGFSSGENYREMEALNIEAFIPIHGTYKSKRIHFQYHKRGDFYKCRNGAKLKFTSIGQGGGYLKKRYYSSKKDCNYCPFREECVGAQGNKKIEHTIYRDEYERMIKRLKSEKGKRNYKLRMCTVEPVFGTLQQHMGLRGINVRGKESANKVILMAAAAFNLKKWMKTISFYPFSSYFESIKTHLTLFKRRYFLKLENQILIVNNKIIKYINVKTHNPFVLGEFE